MLVLGVHALMHIYEGAGAACAGTRTCAKGGGHSHACMKVWAHMYLCACAKAVRGGDLSPGPSPTQATDQHQAADQELGNPCFRLLQYWMQSTFKGEAVGSWHFSAATSQLPMLTSSLRAEIPACLCM